MIDYRIGDCRELLKEIPDESVRLVVTSPPYNIGKPYGHYKDKIPLDKWQELISDVTREVYRILTPDGSFFLNLSPVPFGNDKEILPMPFLGYEIFKKNNLYLRNMITWTCPIHAYGERKLFLTNIHFFSVFFTRFSKIHLNHFMRTSTLLYYFADVFKTTVYKSTGFKQHSQCKKDQQHFCHWSLVNFPSLLKIWD